MTDNPFRERGRITGADRFVGRWGELSLIFERIEAGRPVMISGVPGIGRSSLLTHIVQSAAINLEMPELETFYLDLAAASSAEQVYSTLIGGLGERGRTLADLEAALQAIEYPVLFCLDNAQESITAGWGDLVLEALARLVRAQVLRLVVAVRGEPPALSERFAQIGLGAFAPTEVRLLGEAYLEGTGIQFTPHEYDELRFLSAGHPAYLQRAAFHLFRHKHDTSIDWRAAYLTEALAQPIPGAPLPPAVFEGDRDGLQEPSRYELVDGEVRRRGPDALPIPELPAILAYLPVAALGLLIAALGYPLPGALLAVLGVLAVRLWLRRARVQ